MKLIITSILGLVLVTVQAAEPTVPAATPAAPATVAPAPPAAGAGVTPAPAEGETGPGVAPTKASLEQAFDGAMTCSALAAVKALQAGKDEAWRWQNRAFVFGMLAARFYGNATKDPISNEDMDNMLTEYANSLSTMPAAQREPFETGCARKYPQMDQLCEINKCPHAAPGTRSPTPPAAAAPAKADAPPATVVAPLPGAN